MESEKKLLSLTEVSEEFDKAKYHFKESHRHALQGVSSLLKILSIVLEENPEIPGTKAANTVLLLLKASVDIWAAKVAPDVDEEIMEAKKDAYDTILKVLEAEREIIVSRKQQQEKKEYLEAIDSIIELIRKEMEKIDRENRKEDINLPTEIPIE